MSLLANTLAVRDVYASESETIRIAFERSHDGEAAICRRSDLVDSVILQLSTSEPATESGPICLVAVGGYGRGTLFPCSDVDLLFICEQPADEQQHKGRIAKLCRALWDLHLRVSPSVRTLQDCGTLLRDNLEFNISLLDCRYLCGDMELFEQLHSRVIPRMVAREASEMMQRLCEMTRRRHQKHGHTIFHLEPNIKEYPGGIRDYQVACWLATISELEKNSTWPRRENLLPEPLRPDCSAALQFLSSVRCFLHYQQKRNLNLLTYDLQTEAATRGIGLPDPVAPADWMRAYFRHTRAVYRLTVLHDEVPAAQSGLYRVFQKRKSRLSNADFTVVQGRVFLRQRSSLTDPSLLFSLFEFVARHGVKLSAETERCVEAVLPEIQGQLSFFFDLWEHFRRILVRSHAGVALRLMHRLGLLVMLFKEFQLVDSLVIRDYYHRHTVDEHSFVAIEAVHELSSPDNELHGRFRDILLACERPELLLLALLFHDVGKGMPVSSHVEGSLQALPGIFDRLRLEPEDCEVVRFLIANHLRMSATILQRNIFDPETVQSFAQSVATVERLKMLTLFTYADISAVNPQALTPWKAEMLWRLFAASENFLNRSVDDQRLHTSGADSDAEQIPPDWTGSLEGQDLHLLLNGFPKRYLVSHTQAEVLAHAEMWRRLGESGVQVQVAKRDSCYQLTLLTADRPRLFATLAGVLACWQMNILKAEAFSNKSGVVLDTIRFADRFLNLELNPSETRRLERDVADAVSGELDVDRLVDERARASWPRPKLVVQPRLHFDNECSSHSTLLELIAGDRPGLLYDVSTAIAELGCNIEVALIDTQGQTALDVLYLTWQGGKLDGMMQDKLRVALLELL